MPNSREPSSFAALINFAGPAAVFDADKGLKFVAGNTADVPLPPWFRQDEGVILSRILADEGEVALESGGLSFVGVDGWKTHVHRWTGLGTEPDGPLVFFPDGVSGATKWVWGIWGWVVNGEIQDLDTMQGFNDVINSEGF